MVPFLLGQAFSGLGVPSSNTLETNNRGAWFFFVTSFSAIGSISFVPGQYTPGLRCEVGTPFFEAGSHHRNPI